MGCHNQGLSWRISAWFSSAQILYLLQPSVFYPVTPNAYKRKATIAIYLEMTKAFFACQITIATKSQIL